MFDWVKQQWVWAAAAAVVGLLGFLFTHLVGRRRFRYWRLQRAMDAERSFYATIAPPRRPDSGPRSEGVRPQYIASVDQGLMGVAQLPPATSKEAKEQLRRLISGLRVTHQTLVTALEPFSLGDARQFFDGFDGFNQKLQTLYYGGSIPHDARTHCTEISEVVGELESRLRNQAQGWQDIASLRYSVVTNDQDVIVPMMEEVLERAQTEMQLIGQSIREGRFAKAVVLKERFWFEVKGFYLQLTTALAKMSELVAAL